jgi:hypothetical protein
MIFGGAPVSEAVQEGGCAGTSAHCVNDEIRFQLSFDSPVAGAYFDADYPVALRSTSV